MPPRKTSTNGMRKPPLPTAPTSARRPSSVTPPGSPKRVQLRNFKGQYKGAGIAWIGLEASQEYIADVKRKTDEGAQRAARRLVDETVTWMKANAPWTDRTGDARSGLQGEIDFKENPKSGEAALRIYLGHSVFYGIYLEMGYGGRFQIIRPGMERIARKLPESIVREIKL